MMKCNFVLELNVWIKQVSLFSSVHIDKFTICASYDNFI